MNNFIKDLRYALRSLLKQTSFTAIAVLTLALGIGATATIFSVINGLILHPPLIMDPDRVVAVWKTPLDKRTEGLVSYLDLQDWRARSQSFADIAGYKPNDFYLTEQGVAERIQGMRVTANFFPLLKIGLFRGRNFQNEEDKRGSQPVAIISYEFWKSRFSGDESVLNRQRT